MKSVADVKIRARALIVRASALGLLPSALRAGTTPRTSVFLLHRRNRPELGIHGHNLDELRQALRQLRDAGTPFVSMDAIAQAAVSNAPLPPGAVTFTMDDGYLDQATELAPIFLEAGVPLSIFVITDLLDGRLWPWDAKISHIFECTTALDASIPWGRGLVHYSWSTDEQRTRARRNAQLIASRLPRARRDEFIATLSRALGVELPDSPPAKYQPMTWNDARRLEALGIRFGSHSASHDVLSTATESQIADELSLSHDALRRELKSPLPVLATPVGTLRDYDSRVCAIAREVGYSALTNVSESYTQARGRRQLAGLPIIDRFSMPLSATEIHWLSLGLSREGRGQRELPAHSLTLPVAGDEPTSPLARPRRLLGRIRRSALSNRSSRHLRTEIDWRKVERLIFVCTGNICRSPYAEWAARAIGCPATSAGIRATSSSPADPTALRMALAFGVDLGEHQSRNIGDLELTDSDLVLAMEPSQLFESKPLYRSGHVQTALLGGFLLNPRAVIPDPYGQPDSEFMSCFMAIDEAVRAVADRMNSRTGPTAG